MDDKEKFLSNLREELDTLKFYFNKKLAEWYDLAESPAYGIEDAKETIEKIKYGICFHEWQLERR